MTKRIDPEIKAMKAIARALDSLPRDAQLRDLAYFVARAANVGSCSASEWLYELARRERALQSESKAGTDG